MENAAVTRKLAVILAADVAGYSRLMAVDEEGTLATLNARRQVIDELIVRYHGRIFTTAGDSVMAEFASAVEAVRCAAAIQQEVERRNADLPEPRRMLFRVGVNLGDVMVSGDNLRLTKRVRCSRGRRTGRRSALCFSHRQGRSYRPRPARRPRSEQA